MTIDDLVATLTRQERAQLVELALGRIFRLGSRPTQPGDVAVYEHCRAIIVAICGGEVPSWQPNHARDYHK